MSAPGQRRRITDRCRSAQTDFPLFSWLGHLVHMAAGSAHACPQPLTICMSAYDVSLLIPVAACCLVTAFHREAPINSSMSH